ncbi:MAG: DUF4173 domain-containing protein [Patescibacteria group bacterium]
MNGQESPAVENKSIIFIVFALVLACLFDYFFVWKIPGISVLAFTLLIGFSLIFLTWLFNRKFSRDVFLLLILAMFFSGMVAIRANVLLTILNILGTILILLLITEVNVRGLAREFGLSDYLKILGLPFQYLISLVGTFTNIRFPFFKSVDNKSKQIIRGILITFPVIALFAALFSGADPVFYKLFSVIFNLPFVSPEHVYVTIIVFVLICGALGYSFSEKSSIKSVPTAPRRPMGHIETSILLGSVNVLFVIFIALQAGYIFGGVINITNDVFTYAEYARRGFFELIAISAFTYLIMLATEKLIERNTENHSKAFKYLSAALVVQVMILMVFASNRLSIYEEAFGFTTLRLYSHVFIVLLAAVYFFLLYKIFIDTRENAFALRTFFAVVFFVAAMNFLNPDVFIAQKNLERFNATGKIDFDYLSGLSSDAAPVLIGIFEKSDATERSPLGRALYDRSIVGPEAWQSWNQSREIEMQLLNSYRSELVAYKDYQKPILNSGI